MFIKIISIKHLQYVHILNLILVIIKFIQLTKTTPLLFSPLSFIIKVACLSFFSVSCNKLKGMENSLFTHTQCIVDYNSNPQCIPLFYVFFIFFFTLSSFFSTFSFFLFFVYFFFFFPKLLSFFFLQISPLSFCLIFVDFTFLILSWLKISLCNFFPLK